MTGTSVLPALTALRRHGLSQLSAHSGDPFDGGPVHLRQLVSGEVLAASADAEPAAAVLLPLDARPAAASPAGTTGVAALALDSRPSAQRLSRTAITHSHCVARTESE